MSESPAAPSGNVIVTAERLAELERLEKELIELKSKTTSKYENLKSKDTPEKSKQRVKKYYETHKDEINAKKREKRKLARESMRADEKLPE